MANFRNRCNGVVLITPTVQGGGPLLSASNVYGNNGPMLPSDEGPATVPRLDMSANVRSRVHAVIRKAQREARWDVVNELQAQFEDEPEI